MASTFRYRNFGTPEYDYTYAVSNAYNSFREIFNPSLALEKDPDIWRKIRLDPTMQAGINKAISDIARPDWVIRAVTDSEVDRAVAAIMTDLVMNCRNLKEARQRLAEGYFRGQSYEAIHGVRRLISIRGGPVLPWFVPTHLQNFNHLRVIRQSERIKGPDGRWRLEVKRLAWDIANEEWVEWTNPEWFIKSIWDDTEEWLGFGRGIIEACYFYWWMKGQILMEGLQGIKRWAQGTVLVKVDANSPGSVARNSDKAQAKFIDKIEKMRQQHVLVFDSRDTVELKEMSGTGWQVVMDALRYLDDGITRVLTGSLRPSGGGGGPGQPGAARQAGVEAQESEAQVQPKRDKISEDISRDLIGLVWNLNRANFAELGYGAAQIPYWETPHEPRFDPLKNAQIIQAAHDAGVDLDVADVYEKLGLERPQPGAPVIKGATTPAPAMVPGGGFAPGGGSEDFGGQ